MKKSHRSYWRHAVLLGFAAAPMVLGTRFPAHADDAPVATQQTLKTSADYNEALQRDSRDVASLIGRGEAFLREGKGRQALADFNRAVLIAPGNPDAIAGRARIMVASRQPELAISEISTVMARIRAERKESSAAKLFGARGAAFIALKRYDEAIIDYNQAIEFDSQPPQGIFSQNDEWYFNRGVAWLNLKDDAHALADFGVALKLKPAYAANVKGSRLEKDLKPHDPDASVIVANPDTAILHKLMGNEWAAAESHTEAAREFQKAIAIDANYADAYNNLGLAQMMLENFEAAQRSMDKAIALKADDPRFYYNRSSLHMRRQRAAEAIADARKATELAPQNTEFWIALAAAQQANAEYSNAETTFNQALKMKEGKGPTFELRGKILLARAMQNISPTKEELYALFYNSGGKNEDVKSFADFLEAEVKLHAGVAALVALRDAVVAERDRKKPLFVP